MTKKTIDNQSEPLYTNNKELLETINELSKQLNHKPNIIDSGPIHARVCKSIISNDGPKR